MIKKILIILIVLLIAVLVSAEEEFFMKLTFFGSSDNLNTVVRPETVLASAGEELFKELISFGSDDNSNRVVRPEMAFKVKGSVAGHMYAIDFDILDGYYLYKDKLSVTDADGNELIDMLPADMTVNDDYFGEVKIYRNHLEIQLSTVVEHQTEEVTVKYQGCKEREFCYMPQTKKIKINNVSILEK